MPRRKLDLNLEFRGIIVGTFGMRICFKATPNEITRGGMQREKRSTPGAEPWGFPTFISQGEEGANRRDRENIARGGGKPGESCVCKVRLDQV